MEEDKTIKLIKAVKELNIGMGSLVDFLATKGYRVEKHPMAKLTQEMYTVLIEEFKNGNSSANSIKGESHLPSIESKNSSSGLPGVTIVGKIDLNNILGNSPLSLIKKCLEDKSATLDLGRSGLKSVDFQNGSQLDKILRQCSHLTTLSFSNEYWSVKDSFSAKSKVQSKNKGSRNFLTEIPDAVRSLKNLKELICCGDADFHWEIENLNILTNHTKLAYLDFSCNQINTLKDVKKLVSLRTFILHHNKVRFINNLLKLPLIENLDLEFNSIEKMPFIQQNPSLEAINVSNNNITEFLGLEKYDKLKVLAISKNNIQRVEDFASLLEKNENFHLQIHDNPFLNDYQLTLLPNENHLKFIKEILQRIFDHSIKVEIQY